MENDPNLSDILALFSRLRLGGESVPEDVKVLLGHHAALAGKLALELNWTQGWAPWLDTSYLSAADMANPDIAANVKAIHEVCGCIAFIASDEESQYYGYWRGPEKHPITESPIVLLDNEGQFRICAGSSFAEAIFVQMSEYYGQKEGELRDWLRSLGCKLNHNHPDDVSYPELDLSPDQLHQKLYKQYLPEK